MEDTIESQNREKTKQVETKNHINFLYTIFLGGVVVADRSTASQVDNTYHLFLQFVVLFLICFNSRIGLIIPPNKNNTTAYSKSTYI